MMNTEETLRGQLIQFLIQCGLMPVEDYLSAVEAFVKDVADPDLAVRALELSVVSRGGHDTAGRMLLRAAAYVRLIRPPPMAAPAREVKKEAPKPRSQTPALPARPGARPKGSARRRKT